MPNLTTAAGSLTNSGMKESPKKSQDESVKDIWMNLESEDAEGDIWGQTPPPYAYNEDNPAGRKLLAQLQENWIVMQQEVSTLVRKLSSLVVELEPV
ncbi:hypothetical protein PtA15_4A266 [Puccinia triticina]|uniref:Uncharacterized protein n=1 Tax=Puccinia triticina TaxID=208348 RepID=A0ABY7CM06_9BASI|nr:uncharacterized protein PtA15_4A266 [Puccinia triticina]WAQ83817.1 hypothetical protein PtA15_4A266 [Puccinia triticina]WAR54660.1 hypothetical protein PtB15_4B277 [Puccinia triticina]